MESTKLKPHAILLASPGMGHLIPIIEFGRTLVDHHNFEATVFVLPAESSIADSKETLRSPNPEKLRIVSLPHVDISSLIYPSARVGAKVVLFMRLSVPNLRAAIKSMNVKPTVMIVDLFGTEAFAVAEEFNMLKFLFSVTGAWSLAVTLHLPFIDLKAKDDHVIRHEPLRVPGIDPELRFEDTHDYFKIDPTNLAFLGAQAIARRMLTADGILINSFEALEPSSMKALRDNKMFDRSSDHLLPVLSIGPLVKETRPINIQEKNHALFSWLDMQPSKSVVYVSFGSGGTLSAQQTEELAWGLELSGQKFIWVVRSPSDRNDSTFLNIGAQQEDSAMVALRLRPSSSNGVVMMTKEEISKKVRRMMVDEEGKIIRTKLENLKKNAIIALNNGGSSNISLSKFAHDCMTNQPKIRIPTSTTTPTSSPPQSPFRSPRYGRSKTGRYTPPTPPPQSSDGLAHREPVDTYHRAIFLFAPLIISGMLLYMGSVSFDLVCSVIIKHRPALGSVYRSPQIYAKLNSSRRFMQIYAKLNFEI
ncbi:hypothetical protein ACFE04_003042 [Oxalis oulophora]